MVFHSRCLIISKCMMIIVTSVFKSQLIIDDVSLLSQYAAAKNSMQIRLTKRYQPMMSGCCRLLLNRSSASFLHVCFVWMFAKLVAYVIYFFIPSWWNDICKQTKPANSLSTETRARKRKKSLWASFVYRELYKQRWLIGTYQF